MNGVVTLFQMLIQKMIHVLGMYMYQNEQGQNVFLLKVYPLK